MFGAFKWCPNARLASYSKTVLRSIAHQGAQSHQTSEANIDGSHVPIYTHCVSITCLKGHDAMSTLLDQNRELVDLISAAETALKMKMTIQKS